jgi:multiple sugar transport system ATP-binding protein
MNLLPGQLRHAAPGCTIELGGGARLAAPPSRFAAYAEAPVMVGVRPEHLQWAEGAEAALTGTARVVEPLGSDTLVVFDVAGRELQARLPPRLVRHAGDPVRVTVPPEAIHLFDPQTGRRL